MINLRTKISLTVSVLVAAVVAGLGFFTHTFYEKQFRAIISGNQLTMVEILSHEIDTKLSSARNQLVAASKLVPHAALNNAEAAQRFLDSHVELLELFDNHIGLFTPAGIEITESPPLPERRGKDYSQRSYIRETLAAKGSIVTEPYLSSQAHNHPAIAISAPVFDQKEAITGILVGSIDLTSDNILGSLAQRKIGKSGYLYLTTSDRTVVIHPRPERIFKQIVPGMNRLYDRVINEGFEGTDYTVNYAGTEMLTTFKRLKVNKWILAANYPVAEAYAPVHTAVSYFVIGATAGTVVIFVLTWFLMNTITAHLAALTRHVALLPGKQGEERMIQSGSRDEIGSLSQAFNEMVHNLDDQHKALQKSEKMLQAIIDAEPECVKILDKDANLLMMNQAGLSMIQVDSMDQVRGHCVCPLVTSEYRDAFMDLTRRVFEGESGTLVFEIVGLKGIHRWLETHAVPLRNENNEIVSLLGVTRDITDSRNSEKALRESERRFRETLENANLIAVQLDEEGTVTFANKYLAALTGHTVTDIIGSNWMDLLIPAEVREKIREIYSICIHSDKITQQYENEILTKTGERRLIVWTNSYMRGASGAVIGITSLGLDITEHRSLEEQLRQTQKLESIGTLAGGIAHDFNNLLQGVFGYLSMARISISDKDKALSMLEQAEKALHLSVNLTSQLLTFSKGGKPVKKTVKLPPIIENAVKFALSGSQNRCHIRVPEQLWPILADEGQVSQVIHNMVLNADQAMPLGGDIEITASNQEVPGEGMPSILAHGRYVRIAVRDSGAGIPQEYLSKIFDPYFTTKEKGSGLGLATSYSIIRNHGGLIEVSSGAGNGTVFTIYIPAAGAAAEDRKEPVAPAMGRRLKILVMDDEAMVRNVAGELIRALGHEVEHAEHGESAVALYQKSTQAGTPFDLVILDLTIRGGMGGLETLKALKKIDPGVKAAVSSGYSDDAAMGEYKQQGFIASLKKPYAIEGLKKILAELIGESAA
ncbi:MAG: hypothetical protein C0402_00980 [Thermodesulfovibrio sp.]|nr:hypothetical protein [Thermodesulfovibrio sp.]